MRKRLAVFIGEAGREFQRNFIKHTKAIANSRDYDVFVFNNFGSYIRTVLSDTGERDVINIPLLSEFAGIILLPDTFDIDGMEDSLMAKIKAEATCPVVSIRNGSDDTYRIVFDDYQTIYDMTEHFIKVHGFTNICYMSGPYSVEDSLKRLSGFKAAMKDNGIDVPEDAVFEGDFWKFKSKPACDQFLGAYGGKTQAIICANDYMALGIGDELKLRGVNIPGDIALSGFDEIIEGCSYNPVLTTVRMPVQEMAARATNIIERVNSGEEVEKVSFIPGSLLLKASCGCDNDDYRSDVSKYYNQVSDNYVNIRNATLITTDVTNRITEEEKLTFINDFMNIFGFTKNYVCLCTDTYTDDNPYSDQMILRKVLPITDDINNNTELINVPFDRKYILPEGAYDSSKPQCFLILPIHRKEKTFGYMVNEWNDSDYMMFLAPFVESLAMTYDDLRMQDQFSELTEIKRQNLLDPLTGLYNRRGYEQNLKKLTTGGREDIKYVSLVSCDLDNLKPINDNYGHYEGDVALKAFAEVLKDVCDPDDICSRIGGDEFYVVLTSQNPEYHQNFAETVEKKLREKSRELNRSYTIHASIGMVSVAAENLGKASEYLQLADRRMYESKINYKRSLTN